MTSDSRTKLIENSIYRGKRETETRIHSPLFGREIGVMIQHDHDRTEISDQQVRTVESFAQIETGLDRVKLELFRHWQTVDGGDEFEFANPDEAFARAELLYLLVPPRQEWDGNVSYIRFKVDWDVEHGAAIFVIDGVIDEFANR
jgi:hypothetical protein